ncbi:MAG: hypothetical protein ACU0CO_18235 [Shimia sp.]
MDPARIDRQLANLSSLVTERTGVSGRDLAVKLKRLKRRLPRYERGQAQVLIDAEERRAHPKLARQMVPEEIARARVALELWLAEVDPAERYKAVAFSALGTFAAGLLGMIAFLLALFHFGAG